VVEERHEYVSLKHRLAVTYVATKAGGGGHGGGHGGHEEGHGGKEDYVSNASYTDDAALQKVLEGYRSAKHAAEHHKEKSKPCCDPCAICGCCGLCACLPCCAEEEEEEEEDDFNEIYMFGNPTYYFRAVEMQIMFTCMYMGLWATNYVTIVQNFEAFEPLEKALVHAALVVPILVAFNRVAYIAETCSLILAISHLNIEVMCKSPRKHTHPHCSSYIRPDLTYHQPPTPYPLPPTPYPSDDVLVNTEDMENLASELRTKIMSKIKVWVGVEEPTLEMQKKVSNAALLLCCTAALRHRARSSSQIKHRVVLYLIQ
jgi:hypothetical protein